MNIISKRDAALLKEKFGENCQDKLRLLENGTPLAGHLSQCLTNGVLLLSLVTGGARDALEELFPVKSKNKS